VYVLVCWVRYGRTSFVADLAEDDTPQEQQQKLAEKNFADVFENTHSMKVLESFMR